MAAKHTVEYQQIDCGLTNRTVTIATNVATMYGEGPIPIARNEGRVSCTNRSASCPRTCMYLGGSVNPEV